MQNYFPDLVGQEIVKKKLSFYIEAFNTTSQAPFLLMAGAKGLGKTEFAKGFAKNLYNQDGDKRSFVEINCSTIKNNEQFFEQIFLPLISDNEITILFDECHALPQDLTMAFLTIFNAESNSRKVFEWDGMSFVFNFKQQTFIFATTETDKIFPPLKDRFTIVDFEPYNQEELAQIVQLCLPDIIFSDQKCLLKIASTIRNNARSAVKRSKEIMLYCGKNGSNIFTSKDFDILCDQIECKGQAFFYHSSCSVPVIVGICTVIETGVIDPTAFDNSSPYFDPKSDPDPKPDPNPYRNPDPN